MSQEKGPGVVHFSVTVHDTPCFAYEHNGRHTGVPQQIHILKYWKLLSQRRCQEYCAAGLKVDKVFAVHGVLYIALFRLNSQLGCTARSPIMLDVHT